MRLIDADEVIRQLEAERDLILPSTGQYYHDRFARNNYNHAIEIVKGAVPDEDADIAERLAAYEDTGLTPEDIRELERKYLNDEHEYCGEYGTDDCQFAYRIDKVKQERDFWEFEAKKNCAALGEQKIKFQQPDCDKISKQKNGKCLGYCYSETDDEPIDACKYCELYESYEDAD